MVGARECFFCALLSIVDRVKVSKHCSVFISQIYIYILYINFACLNMKMSNQNLFQKIFLYKTSYISVCSKNFLSIKQKLLCIPPNIGDFKECRHLICSRFFVGNMSKNIPCICKAFMRAGEAYF